MHIISDIGGLKLIGITYVALMICSISHLFSKLKVSLLHSERLLLCVLNNKFSSWCKSFFHVSL